MKKFIYPFIFLIGAVCAGCSGRPVVQVGKRLSYPQAISPIFFLDTLQIFKPIVVYIDSLPYITSVEVFNSVADKSTLRKTRGVLRYLTDELSRWKTKDYFRIYFETGRNETEYFYRLYEENHLNHIERFLTLLDSIQGLPVYRFDFQPRKFLLTLVVDSFEQSFEDRKYSNDHVLALLPIFSHERLVILQDRCADYYIMTEKGCYLEEYDPSKHR